MLFQKQPCEKRGCRHYEYRRGYHDALRKTADPVALLKGVREAAGLNSLAAFLEQRALQLGLVLLMIAVLSPLSTKQVTMDQVLRAFCTWPGLLAIVGGAAATYVNGQGVQLLHARPDIIAGILVGTVIGVFLLRGIPVGPLAAAGITALLLRLIGWK